MNIRCIAGVVYFSAAGLLCAAPLDDKIKAFEDAVQKTPAVKLDASAGIWPSGRDVTVGDLNAVIQRGNNDGEICAIVSRLAAAHPSDSVKQTGAALLEELQAQHDDRAKAFASKADAVLAETPDAITHAKTAADLDGILKEFQAFQNLPGSSPEVANKVATTFRFITQWQDYLAATESANWPEAQNNLRAILDNRQIDAPAFFPRSEILRRYQTALRGGVPEPSAAPASNGPVVTDPDEILRKIQKPADVETYLGQLEAVPPPPGFGPWDWTALIALGKANADATSGFNTSVDLKQAMTGPDWGFELSRVTAIELLSILPHYLNTDVAAPPRDKETVNAYLDRIASEAAAAGNLALLQRTIAVKVALGTASGGAAPGTVRFLAGLSQETAGQFAPAVNSYENALTQPDLFLPAKIVGDRLAAIKATQPDDFDKGMTSFLSPPMPVDLSDPFMRQRMMMNPAMMMMPGQPPYGFPGSRPFEVSVLPIPMTLTIPLLVTPSAPTPGQTAPAPATK